MKRPLGCFFLAHDVSYCVNPGSRLLVDTEQSAPAPARTSRLIKIGAIAVVAAIVVAVVGLTLAGWRRQRAEAQRSERAKAEKFAQDAIAQRKAEAEVKRLEIERQERLVAEEKERARKTEEARIAAEARAREKEARRVRMAAEAKAAAEKARKQAITDYVAERYLDEKAPLAAIAVDSGGVFDPALSERLSRILVQSSVMNDWRVFRPAFMSSKYFGELVSGRYRSSEFFKPGDYCERVLVMKATHSLGQISEPANMTVDDLTLMLQVISADDGHPESGSDVRVRGIGFNEADARKSALERAENELRKFASILSQKKR